jgi:hypothetical protein
MVRFVLVEIRGSTNLAVWEGFQGTTFCQTGEAPSLPDLLAVDVGEDAVPYFLHVPRKGQVAPPDVIFSI